jgi:hypothetical protein
MSRTRNAHRRTVVATAAAVLVVGLTPAGAAGSGGSSGGGDPGVVLSWNAIAWRTIGVEGMKPPPVAQLYLGLVSTAVHDAVVAVEGGGEPTLRQPPAPEGAASDVAAATAAYELLVHFFPASRAALDADYAAFLAGVPDDERRAHGQQVGHEAAATLAATRVGDGRDAPITVPRPPDPPAGMWVPTGNGEFLAAWLGATRPVLIESSTQFADDGPDALTSEEYAADLAEVKAMGAATGSARSEADTEVALFWSDNPPRQYQDAMRDRAVRHGMDIVETARMFAATNAAGADALITCWQGKLDTNFWRPVTAIQQADRDGNPATVADPAWASLRPAPPYPEWPSGHGCVSSAVAETLEELFGRGEVDLDVRSEVTGTTRHYDSEEAWLDDVVNARIWLGIHFRDAMDDARDIGNQVADHVVDGWFECEDDCGDD